ncbi:hypothetical protein CS542_07785 [Pedobacter sp. IW39]|nr:hypothetical protein CS542_07785 [Pedobacter sp. IW39]
MGMITCPFLKGNQLYVINYYDDDSFPAILSVNLGSNQVGAAYQIFVDGNSKCPGTTKMLLSVHYYDAEGRIRLRVRTIWTGRTLLTILIILQN